MPVLTADQITAEAARLVGRGVRVAGSFLSSRLKEVLSVAAPRRTVTSRSGIRYYVATSPAQSGAPPRKLSGRLRASIATEYDAKTQTARVGTNVFYGRVHEEGDHPWLGVTVDRYRGELARIIQGAATI